MRGLAVAILVLGVAPVSAAWQSDVMPGDRLRTALLVLDYEQPWPGLSIRRGAAAVGFPLPGELVLGARVRSLGAPTVSESALGGWVSSGRWLFLALDRVRLGVDGLDAEARVDFEAALQLGSGPLTLGWATRVEGAGDPASRAWRRWWAGLGTRGIEVALGRRLTPWQPGPAWTLAVRLALGGGVEAALGWLDHQSTLALSWDFPSARVTSATAWSGPRAGGFSFRLEAGSQ